MTLLSRCLLSLMLASGAIAHAHTPYQVIDLGPAGSTSAAVGINESGQVAGYSYNATGGNIFLWDPVSGRQDIAAWNNTTTFARGLNDQGQIVGTVYPFRTRAFLHTPSTGYRVYGTLTGTGPSEGRAVNNAGQIVGSSITASGETHAIVDTPGVGMVDLGTLPGGSDSIANAINNSGWITGSSNATGGGSPRPFLYTAQGGMVQLSEASGAGHAINDRGEVAGWVTDGGRFHAFVHRPGEGMDVFGWDDSMANGINNHGAITGHTYVHIEREGDARAFYYSPETGRVNLNDVLDPVSGEGWVIESGADINDVGWIVGHGRINGETHAVLLKPVPEPQTWALMLAGLGLLAGVTPLRRRLASPAAGSTRR